MNTTTLEQLFDETVEYKLPIASGIGATVDPHKKDILPTVRDAYLEVNRSIYDTDKALPINPFENTVRYKVDNVYHTDTTKPASIKIGSKIESLDKLTKISPRYLLPPRYVSAVDVFYPEMGYLLVFGKEGINFLTLPLGHASAFYHGDTKSLAIDTIAIPGTSKNSWAQKLYRSGLDTVNRLIRANPRMYGSLRTLKQFYRGMLDELSSKRRMKKTIIHEMSHHVLEEEGIAPYLTSAVNEGLTENLTEEITGEPSTLEGTTYHDFKTRVRSGFRRFANSTKGFLNKYREKGRSLIDTLYEQPEVRALAVA